mmetsp:Transcript_8840/g.14494  ORF Transcript_8840/g.14494 Transcript_8840/m.14494 type:complete len:105 (-) Transcript_8840:1625-1939(-)
MLIKIAHVSYETARGIREILSRCCPLGTKTTVVLVESDAYVFGLPNVGTIVVDDGNQHVNKPGVIIGWQSDITQLPWKGSMEIQNSIFVNLLGFHSITVNSPVL